MKKLSECDVGLMTVEVCEDVVSVSVEVDEDVVLLFEQVGDKYKFNEDFEITTKQKGIILTSAKLLTSVTM